MKEPLKETNFSLFFCAFCHPRNCQGREAKNRWVSGSGNESLVSKRGTKCTQKSVCPEMHGFCNFEVFVDQKSRAPERVKRDPHVFDLVLFLHLKKCLTCGCEKFALLLVLETVPLNLYLVGWLTSNGIFRTQIRE